MVELHSLMLISWQKDITRSHFIRNPTFGVIQHHNDFLASLKTTGGEKDFLDSLV